MPKVSGIEILERIVSVDPGVDVILITAHYSAESAVEAIQKGAADYLTKPIEIDKLRSRISYAAGRSGGAGRRHCVSIRNSSMHISSKASLDAVR